MLLNKTITVLIAIFFVVVGWLYFSTNSSYQLAFKAKIYYGLENYDKAYELSSQACELDFYNKLAMTLKRKSGDAVKLQRYINQGNEYLSKIQEFANGEVTVAQRERIKIMCDIMIEELDMIMPTIAYKELLKDAKAMQENFKKLKSELFE